MANKWDDYDYLRYAYRVAAEKSTDPSTQNGAILVDKGGVVVATAANHFPLFVKETEERWQRPLKYAFVEHAERNLVYSLVGKEINLNGMTMYCCWAACPDCARAIIQSGIRKVVTHEHEYQLKQSHWLGQIKTADQMLKEACVDFKRISGKVGGVQIRFGGELIDP